MAQRRPQTLAIVEPHGFDAFGRNALSTLHVRRTRRRNQSPRCGSSAPRDRSRHTHRVNGKAKPRILLVTFALFKVGAVVVLIDPGMGTKNLGICLKEAEPEAFTASPKRTWLVCFFAGPRDDSASRHGRAASRLGGHTRTRYGRLGAGAGERLVPTQPRNGRDPLH